MDYIIFDNVTSTNIRMDWGIKLATGELSENSVLINRFRQYCDAIFSSDRTAIPAFGAGVGGFPVAGNHGYLLCVTLGRKDRWERRSFGTVGIYFKSKEALVCFLEKADAKATAEQVYESDTPPENLKPMLLVQKVQDGASSLFEHFLRNTQRGKVVEFQEKTSLNDAVALLVNCAKRDHKMPAIMGSSFDIDVDKFKRNGFDFVFFISDESSSENRQARLFLSRGGEYDKKKQNYPPFAEKTERASSPSRPAPLSSLIVGVILLLLLVVTSGVLFMISERSETMRKIQTTDADEQIAKNPVPKKEPPDVKGEDEKKGGKIDFDRYEPDPTEKYENQTTAQASVEGEEKEHSGEFGENVYQSQLDSAKDVIYGLNGMTHDDMENTLAYQLLSTVLVNQEHMEKAAGLKRAIERIAQVQKEIEKVNLIYFYNKDTLEILSPKERVSGIAENVAGLDLDCQSCEELKKAFGFIFLDSDDPLTKWCKHLSDVSAIATNWEGFK